MRNEGVAHFQSVYFSEDGEGRERGRGCHRVKGRVRKTVLEIEKVYRGTE